VTCDFKPIKIIFQLMLLLPILAFAHGGAVDKQGGHFNRKDNILIIATKSLVFQFTSKQKRLLDKPTQALIAEYITAETGRTG
jgi:hypothetical protein